MTTSWTSRTSPTTTYTTRTPVSVKSYLLINATDKLLINATDYLLISQVLGTPYTTRTPI